MTLCLVVSSSSNVTGKEFSSSLVSLYSNLLGGFLGKNLFFRVVPRLFDACIRVLSEGGNCVDNGGVTDGCIGASALIMTTGPKKTSLLAMVHGV